MKRRDFLKTFAGMAALTIVPRHVLGGTRYTAPSDQLTKGIIGVGGMGRGHYGYAGTRLVAICDVDKNHLAAGEQLASDKLATYSDYRKLIEDPNVDIVHIATPPHWHGIMSVDAARAGKDIWCEKPMTRTIGEGKRVMEAVKQHGNIFRLNTWFRFTDTFYGMNTTVDKIKKLVDSGMLGWPLKVTISKHTGFNWKFFWVGNEKLEEQKVPAELDYDMWLGPAPYKPYNAHRVHETFRGYWDYDAGGLGDTCSVRTKPARSRSRSTRRSSIPTRWVRGVKSNILTTTAAKSSCTAKTTAVRAILTSRARTEKYTPISSATFRTGNANWPNFPTRCRSRPISCIASRTVRNSP